MLLLVCEVRRNGDKKMQKAKLRCPCSLSHHLNHASNEAFHHPCPLRFLRRPWAQVSNSACSIPWEPGGGGSQWWGALGARCH